MVPDTEDFAQKVEKLNSFFKEDMCRNLKECRLAATFTGCQTPIVRSVAVHSKHFFGLGSTILKVVPLIAFICDLEPV
jgi:hypothetical protein